MEIIKQFRKQNIRFSTYVNLSANEELMNKVVKDKSHKFTNLGRYVTRESYRDDKNHL